MLVACAAPSSDEKDSGLADAGRIVFADSGTDVDAGDVADAGDIDDAGTTDAGSFDAGTSDAGPVDAGTSDAGQPDSGFTGVTHGQWTVSADLIRDSATGLIWDATNGPGSASFPGTSHYKWEEAKAYCAGRGARLATYEDLPTASESVALSVAANADWTNFTAAFGGTWDSWSSTEVDGLPAKAWHYYLDHTGSAVGYRGFKDDGYNARCVR